MDMVVDPDPSPWNGAGCRPPGGGEGGRETIGTIGCHHPTVLSTCVASSAAVRVPPSAMPRLVGLILSLCVSWVSGAGVQDRPSGWWKLDSLCVQGNSRTNWTLFASNFAHMGETPMREYLGSNTTSNLIQNILKRSFGFKAAEKLPVQETFDVLNNVVRQVNVYPKLHQPLISTLRALLLSVNAYVAESVGAPLQKLVQKRLLQLRAWLDGMDEATKDGSIKVGQVTLTQRLSASIRRFAKKMRLSTWESTALAMISWHVDQDTLKRVSNALLLVSYGLDFHSDYLMSTDGLISLLQKLEFVARKSGSLEVQTMAQNLQSELRNIPSSLKERFVNAIHGVWDFHIAALAAEKARLPNKEAPSPLGCRALHPILNPSLHIEILRLLHMDPPTQKAFDDTVDSMLRIVARDGKGCAASMRASKNGNLFGGVKFPEKVAHTLFDLIWGLMPSTSNEQNLYRLMDFIEAGAQFAQKALPILASRSDFKAHVNDPWLACTLMKHCKTLGLNLMEVQANPSVLGPALKQAVMLFHPDKPGGDTEKFMAVKEAYDSLRVEFQDRGSKISSRPNLLANIVKDVLSYTSKFRIESTVTKSTKQYFRKESPINVTTHGVQAFFDFLHKQAVERYLLEDAFDHGLPAKQVVAALKDVEARLALPPPLRHVAKLLDGFLAPDGINRCHATFGVVKHILHEYVPDFQSFPSPTAFFVSKYFGVDSPLDTLHADRTRLLTEESESIKVFCSLLGKHLDKDGDGKYEHDDVLQSVDTNGDGQFGIDDVVSAGQDILTFLNKEAGAFLAGVPTTSNPVPIILKALDFHWGTDRWLAFRQYIGSINGYFNGDRIEKILNAKFSQPFMCDFLTSYHRINALQREYHDYIEPFGATQRTLVENIIGSRKIGHFLLVVATQPNMADAVQRYGVSIGLNETEVGRAAPYALKAALDAGRMENVKYLLSQIGADKGKLGLTADTLRSYWNPCNILGTFPGSILTSMKSSIGRLNSTCAAVEHAVYENSRRYSLLFKNFGAMALGTVVPLLAGVAFLFVGRTMNHFGMTTVGWIGVAYLSWKFLS